jgi:NAD+ synthase
MATRFKILMVQANPVLGALAANAERAFAEWQRGRDAGVDLVMLSEMFLTGYQTQDLVLKAAFIEAAEAALAALSARLGAEMGAETGQGPALGIGLPLSRHGHVFNAYVYIQGGRTLAEVLKHDLPNDSVFDERRVFASAPLQKPFQLGPLKIGTPICEDAWHATVAKAHAEGGAELLLVPNGSPYHRGKPAVRVNLMRWRVGDTGMPLVYLNMVGGQDDQVFDGASFVMNPGGEVAVQLPQFDEASVVVSFAKGAAGWHAEAGAQAEMPRVVEADYRAMVLSVKDYLSKTGFRQVILGLSGGIDSALVATIATDALGPQNVRCVMMPSRFTSQISLHDAESVARALGTRLDTVPITGAQGAVGDALAPLFAGTEPGIPEENIQSRLRGLLLMALSNKFGEMLLTTGNKSEMAVGYCTIYGDMNGGYNPLKDLYKTRVFETCRWRNENHRPWMSGPQGVVIPARVIEKPPSAELRDNQKDEDSLPPYFVLDAILDGLIEREASVADLVAEGHDRAVVKRIEHLLYISEYKRFQSAPGTRLTKRALWLDRRYPIAMRYRDDA